MSACSAERSAAERALSASSSYCQGCFSLLLNFDGKKEEDEFGSTRIAGFAATKKRLVKLPCFRKPVRTTLDRDTYLLLGDIRLVFF